jgi:alpha-L-fucosidase
MYRPVGDTSWFVHDRFGMFIHWGLYALPARHEWIKNIEEIPDQKYQQYFRRFEPDLYDPERWAAAAAGAGMKYFVITTKHHEGFCLWDSALTDYKAPNTPAGRDLLRPMVEAFRGAGLRVGLYHSLIDWHHPDFPIDSIHPQRNHPDRDRLNRGRDITRYAEYLRGQVRELLTEFGKIDLIFFDFSYPNGPDRPEGWVGKGRDDWDSKNLLAMVRELQPGILVNDRLDLQDVPGGWDYQTPEQFMVAAQPTDNGKPVVWETCQTFSGSWGYHRDEQTWKSVEQLLYLLIDTVSKNGNLLLNVGPTGRGEFDYRALEALEGIGEWMSRHGRAIYGCGEAPAKFAVPQDCRLTYNRKTRRLYLHLLNWPIQHLYLPGYKDKIAYAQLLNDASEVQIRDLPDWQSHHVALPEGTVTLNLPVRKPKVAVPVVEMFLR